LRKCLKKGGADFSADFIQTVVRKEEEDGWRSYLAPKNYQGS
jgi:hypothetical protein